MVKYTPSQERRVDFSQEQWQNQNPMERPLWRTTKSKPNCQWRRSHQRSPAPNSCHPPWQDLNRISSPSHQMNEEQKSSGYRYRHCWSLQGRNNLLSETTSSAIWKILNYKKSPFRDALIVITMHLKRERHIVIIIVEVLRTAATFVPSIHWSNH